VAKPLKSQQKEVATATGHPEELSNTEEKRKREREKKKTSVQEWDGASSIKGRLLQAESRILQLQVNSNQSNCSGFLQAFSIIHSYEAQFNW